MLYLYEISEVFYMASAYRARFTLVETSNKCKVYLHGWYCEDVRHVHSPIRMRT